MQDNAKHDNSRAIVVGDSQSGGRRGRRRIRWLRWTLLAILLGVMFLPYPYQVGGPLEVLPAERQEIHAETEGVIREALFGEGDWVAEGATIGRLASFRQEKDVVATRAAIAEQEARLAELRSTPRPEEERLARIQVDVADTRARFTREEARRLSQLFESGDVSREDYEDALRKAEVDAKLLIEARAQLDLVRAGPHPQSILAAEAELQRLQAQLQYYEELLARTDLAAPIAGRIVTENLEFMRGRYLHQGDLFATLENSRMAQIRVEISQADVGLLEPGSRMQIKVWSYPNRIFEAEVGRISPYVTLENFRRIAVVVAFLPNEEGELKSGMTGYAKVEAQTMPAFFAFTRIFARFFLVEIWSWLP